MATRQDPGPALLGVVIFIADIALERDLSCRYFDRYQGVTKVRMPLKSGQLSIVDEPGDLFIAAGDGNTLGLVLIAVLDINVQTTWVWTIEQLLHHVLVPHPGSVHERRVPRPVRHVAVELWDAVEEAHHLKSVCNARAGQQAAAVLITGIYIMALLQVLLDFHELSMLGRQIHLPWQHFPKL